MKLYLVLGIAGLVVLGFAGLAIFSTPEAEKQTTNEQPVEVDTKQANNQLSEQGNDAAMLTTDTASIKNLLLANSELQCTFKYEGTGNSVPTEGTLYNSNGRVRGDVLTESPDLTGQINTSFIIDGSMMYVWSDIGGQSYGVKFNYEEVSEDMVNQNTPLPLDDNLNYECVFWNSANQDVFMPPTTVLFQDMTALFEQGMEYGNVYDESAVELPY